MNNNELDNLIDFEFSYINENYNPWIEPAVKISLLNIKFCSYCMKTESPWRNVNNNLYCNACALYIKKYKSFRPESLIRNKFKKRKCIEHEVIIWYPYYQKIIVKE